MDLAIFKELETLLLSLDADNSTWLRDANGSTDLFGDSFDDLLARHSNFDESDNSVLFIHYLDVYFLPLMIVIGIFGNLVSFLVFQATYMKRLSSSLYLAALSIVNVVFLVCVLLSWSVNIGIHTYQRNGFCQMFTFFTYVSSFLSVWFVVSFTAERYIAVHYPLRRYQFCTTSRARIVVVCLSCFAAVIYSYGTWTSGVSHYFGLALCGPLPKYSHVVHIINNIDTVISLLIPFFLILFMNVRIAWKVVQFYRSKRALGGMHSSGERSVRVWGISTTFSRSGYLRNQVRVTKMLLNVSSIFLLLNLPRHSERIYSFIRTLSEPNFLPNQQLVIAQRVFQFLYYLHFCINVFLYSAFGTNFRRAFLCLLRRVKRGIKLFFICHQNATSSNSRSSPIPLVQNEKRAHFLCTSVPTTKQQHIRI